MMQYNFHNYEVQGRFEVQLDDDRRMLTNTSEFCAKIRAGNEYSKATRNRFRDVDYLATRLIAIAFKRSPELLNIGTTSFLSQMVVPGITKGRKGKSTKAVADLRTALGLSG